MASPTGVTVDWSAATQECDVVMKGGITSGVVYPRALSEFAKTYRFRGVGGASAGAIGAAFAAAAEFGRDSGGFDLLERLPDDLGEGALGALFQPQPSTAPLLPILLGATTPGGAGPKVRAVLRALPAKFPGASILGAVWGGILIVVGVLLAIALVKSDAVAAGIFAGVLIVLSGAVLLAIGWAAAMVWRVLDKLTVAVPENLFGICRGLTEGTGPGLTDWLSARIDELAGLPEGSGPLTFGQLWGGDPEAETDPARRDINLLMVSTCLSRTRPYEMPWDARDFFYSPEVWATLFPGYVMTALEAAVAPPPPGVDQGQASEWDWITSQAAAQGLRRLPGPSQLPVIVATRMSLSFPLLISAIPLKSVNFRSSETREALAAYRKAEETNAEVQFETLWFTDGGLCSNFPLYMFDSALPTRPTFAINLGKLPDGEAPSDIPLKNIDWARNNRDGLAPTHRPMAESGFGAVKDFALAALDTARNWQDNSYLDVPGYRDRIVRVLQSDSEGGLNLNMDSETITALAERGRLAAHTMVEQFSEPRYSGGANGWDNHRWVRYRALLAGMPDFLRAYRAGREALAPTGLAPNVSVSAANPPLDPASPPGYPLSVRGRNLGDAVTNSLYTAAAAADAAPAAASDVRGLPRAGRIRKVPRI